jgi:hypothetical protein
VEPFSSYVKLRPFFLSALLVLPAACSKQPDATPPATATPEPETRAAIPPAATPAYVRVPTPEATPAPPAADPNLHILAASPPPADALPDNPSALEALYFVEGTPPARRVEIVRALGRVDSTESAAVLGRIFDRDKRLETRMEAVQAAADFNSPATHAGKLAILTHAVAPTQPETLRLNALQTLIDFDDPTVPALLQTLSNDSTAAVRAAAREGIQSRKR